MDMEQQITKLKGEHSDSECKQLNIVVDAICADVSVRRSSNEMININYVNNGNERQKKMYEFYKYQEGNTIYTGIHKSQRSLFNFIIVEKLINIDIEIPEYMRSVTIKTASGGIQMYDANVECIIANSESGHITINKSVTTDFTIYSTSGNIYLSDLNSVKLIVNTMSGDVTTNNVEAQSIVLKSVSGDMDGNHIKARDCKIHSTSGDINVNVNVRHCNASSKSGNVDVSSTGDLVLESSCMSGNVNVHLNNGENGYQIYSRVNSGNLYINYGLERLINLKSGTYVYGKQSSELILESISGNIYVND